MLTTQTDATPTQTVPPMAPLTVKAWLPLVQKVADRMARRLPPAVDKGDLIGAGTVGLIDAIEKYDPIRCDRFAAYAEIRIRGAMLDELRAMDWVPRSVRHKGARLDDAMHQLSQRLGHAPLHGEAAAFLGLSATAFAELRRDAKPTTLLSADETASEGTARFPVDERAVPDQELAAKEMKQRVAQAITRLPERERQVLSLYYVEELKLKEIGEIFGVTESRICQIHTAAVARVRGLLASEETC